MNVNGGSLEFEIIVNNKQAKSLLNDTARAIQEATGKIQKGGGGISEAIEKVEAMLKKAWLSFDTAKDNQMSAIQELEKEFAKLGEAAGSAYAKAVGQGGYYTGRQAEIAKEVRARRENVKALDETGKALQAEEDKFRSEIGTLDKNEEARKKLRTQIMNLKEALVKADAAGLRGTDQYKAMQKELGRLSSAMKHASMQGKKMGDDYVGLNTTIEVLSGVTGAFSAAQGAVGLFAGENANLQKIMAKVQSLMAITIGLQQVSKTLNKDSYTQLVAVTKAKQLFAAATNGTSRALQFFGVSAVAANVAAKALVGTLTLGLGVAIPFIINGISKLVSKQREAKKEQKEFNEKVAEAASKPVAAIEELSAAWAKLGDDWQAKEKFIEQEKSSFSSLGVSIKTVEQAEKLLVDNKQKFVEACMLKAKALAAQEMAVEKYKKVIKAQNELDKTPQTYHWEKGEYTDGYGTKRKGMVRVEDIPFRKAKDKLKDAEKEYEKYIKMQIGFSEQERAILKSIGQGAGNEYMEGMVGALKKQKAKLQEELDYISDKKSYEKKLKEIEEVEKKIKAITGESGSTKGGAKEKDPYLEKLKKRKEEYEKYFKAVNAKDPESQKFAREGFTELLKGGNSYADYLKKQIDQLNAEIGGGEATKEQAKRLKTLYGEFANETKDTVLAEFERELQGQMDEAQTVIEKLEILNAAAKKELKGDNSDLDNGKKGIIDKQYEGVAKQAKEQTDELVRGYENYLNGKLSKTIETEDKIALLRERAKNAETQEERDKLNRTATFYSELFAMGIDNFEDFRQINEESVARYGTYEQKRLQIVKDYQPLIKAARLAGNEDVAKKLEGEMELEILRMTKDYKQLYEDVGEITVKTAYNAGASMKSVLKRLLDESKITAEQYNQLIDDIDNKVEELTRGRGWERLMGNTKGGGVMNLMFGEGDMATKIKGFSTIFNQPKKDAKGTAESMGKVAENAGKAEGAMGKAANGAAGAIGMVDAIITAVYQTVKAVADTLSTISEYQDSLGHSDSADNLQNWSDAINTVNESVMSGWEKFKSGDALGSVTEAVSMPFKLMATLNRIHDQKIEKKIQRHAAAVKELTNAYNQLEWQVNKALGEDMYKSQGREIENMRAQRAEIEEMIRLEEKKKKTDSNKITEYKEQIRELERSMQDMLDSITEGITQTSAKDLAGQLADAIAGAFTDGFNSEEVNKAIEKVVKETMQNAVKNALKLQFLQTPLQAAIKQLQRDMGFDEYGNGSFDGLDEAEQARFKERIQQIAANYTDALKMYSDLFKDLEDTGDPSGSLSGAIKGASQESINLLVGQTNAVRVNQVDGINIMRQQLLRLAGIEDKAAMTNKLLEQINENTKGAVTASDPLRAQGITV